MDRFTEAAGIVLNKALDAAESMGHTYIGSEHLLLGLLSEKNCTAYRILSSCGISYARSKEIISESAGLGAPSDLSPSDLTPKAKSIIENSYLTAIGYNCPRAATEHILLAILHEDDCVAIRVIELQEGSVDTLISESVSYCRSGSALSGSSQTSRGGGIPLKIGEFGKDLTAAAMRAEIDPVIGRDSETSRLIRILSRRNKNNPVLIGEPGVGKTAIVEGLALRIAEHSVPENLYDKRIFALDLSSMIAGAKYRGDFEDRLRRVINEAVSNKNIILFIDELHTILGAGAAEGAMDAANILKPVLARGDIQIIGATTFAEYRRIEKDAALERRFQSITVEEPTAGQTLVILNGLREKYEKHHGLKISDEALEAAVVLSQRYIPERRLPDKAIDLIDEAAASAKTESLTRPESLKNAESRLARISVDIESAVMREDFEHAASLRREREELAVQIKAEKDEWLTGNGAAETVIGRKDIEKMITEWTGIPAESLAKEEKSLISGLESALQSRIIGQNEAIKKLSDAIKLGRTGIRDPERPVGSFIFAGPTGVGKTETAKAIAERIYGSKKALIRFDMSEFMEKHSVSKLIGSPPGYVGYGDGGTLTESVRRRPYSVILFDEIEKAHPDVLNILLQILDDGILTDSGGKTVSFKNAMMIMTTNIGSDEAAGRKNSPGFSVISAGTRAKEGVIRELSALLRPEFLGRVDEIIVFSPLDNDAIEKITRLKLDELRIRLSGRGIDVEYTDEYVKKLAGQACGKSEGARAVEKAIRARTEADISACLLNDDHTEKKHVLLDYDDGSSAFVTTSKI